VVAVYAASRAVTLAAAYLVTRIHVDPSAADPATRPHTVSQVLSTWDGHWYLELARHGYPHAVPPGDFAAGTGAAAQNGLGFFPLYPTLLRAVHVVSPFALDVDAVLLSLVIGLAATLAVWALVRDRAGDERASRAAMLFCCFPGAFVLSFAYSEGTMLLAAALCLLALRRQRWLWAGIAAAAAGAARASGLVLVPVCAWVALVALRHRPRDLRPLVAPVLAPAGAVAFFAFLRVRTGSWSTWFTAERRGWGHHLDWGHAFVDNLGSFALHPLRDADVAIIGVSTIVAVIGLVALRMARNPTPEVLYSVGMLLLCASAPDLQVRPRFLYGGFPLVTAIGEWTRPRWFGSVLGLSMGLMAALTVLYGLRLTAPEVLFP
jgi:hypothetical protein